MEAEAGIEYLWIPSGIYRDKGTEKSMGTKTGSNEIGKLGAPDPRGSAGPIPGTRETVDSLKQGLTESTNRVRYLECKLRLAEARAEVAEASRDVALEENKEILAELGIKRKAFNHLEYRLKEYEELLERFDDAAD